MKMNQPVGNNLYAPFFLRCTLGAYFILAGVAKLENLDGFVAEVQKLEILSKHFSTVVGILMPYCEVMAGGLLLLGMWTTLGAILGAFLLAFFIYIFGVFPRGGFLFNKDVILFAVALSIMYSGAGAFSVDRFRQTG